ncbi:magnesium transporter [bacterium E08(2017)]|nr:magnesium transporter [bacterium E08(2017)]
MHPADIADFIDHSPKALHEILFDILPEELKPDVLSELEEDAEIDIIESLSSEELSDIVEEMAPDDAADIIADLPEERVSQVLDLMEAEESEDVRELLKYGEETAGGIMTTDVVAMKENQTVDEAINAIASLEPDEEFVYAYIVDHDQTLMGFVSIWDLLREKNKKTPLKELTHRNFISANVDIDQEDVVHLINQYDISAVPVTDSNGKLVGRITADDVIDIMEDEASEDIFRLAGSKDDELDSYSPVKRSMIRLPWLLITLIGGFLIAIIHKSYQKHIVDVTLLAAFIPSILAMGGNTGIQASTLVVRRIALGTLKTLDVGRMLLREIMTGMIMGVVCGLVIGAGAYIIGLDSDTIAPHNLAFIVGFALFSAMTFATTFGAFIPIVLNRFGVDPAIASGPFITITNDIAALLIYFGITVLLLQEFIA